MNQELEKYVLLIIFGKSEAMKARQSKTAKTHFSKESEGRAILKSIREASAKNVHVVANLKVNNTTFIKVKEL